MTGRLTNKPLLSIVVPIWNEINQLDRFCKQFDAAEHYELLFVDGGSTDGSLEFLQQQQGLRVFTSEKGRAKQMNYGAAQASAAWLFFLHVDSQLPDRWWMYMERLIAQQQGIGCFRLQFDHTHPLLRLASYGSRWSSLWFRGGDQGLVVRQSDFVRVGQFDPTYQVCEDLECYRRLLQFCELTVFPTAIGTSARRFIKKGVCYTFFHFRLLHVLHFMGISPRYLALYYQFWF